MISEYSDVDSGSLKVVFDTNSKRTDGGCTIKTLLKTGCGEKLSSGVSWVRQGFNNILHAQLNVAQCDWHLIGFHMQTGSICGAKSIETNT